MASATDRGWRLEPDLPSPTEHEPHRSTWSDGPADATEGYRDAPPTRLRLTSSHQHPLLISDDPSTTQR